MTATDPHGWQSGQLGEFIELKRGYDLPGRDRRDGLVPIVSSSGPSGWHDKAMAKAPGVVTGRYGTIGQIFYVEQDFWPLNTALYVRDFKGNDPRFVAYFLRSVDFNKYVDKAAVPGVNRNHLHLELVRFPPYDEQRRIAAILGALDDKIELNRKMNRTLEKMAQALFKSWFIDFDGHEDLVESEIGPVPRGWTFGTMSDLLVLQRGFDLPATTRQAGGYPVFSAGGFHGMHDEYRASGPGVVTGRSGKLGDVYFVDTDFWPLNTTLWVKEYKRSGPHHAYHLLSGVDFLSLNAGSAVPTLNRNHVHALRVVVPPATRIAQFESFVAPLFRRRRTNSDESRTLTTLRDTLLPKLISGELRVPDAEAAVSEVL